MILSVPTWSNATRQSAFLPMIGGIRIYARSLRVWQIYAALFVFSGKTVRSVETLPNQRKKSHFPLFLMRCGCQFLESACSRSSAFTSFTSRYSDSCAKHADYDVYRSVTNVIFGNRWSQAKRETELFSSAQCTARFCISKRPITL